MSYVALSLGWWLPGNQVIEPSGSPTATAPSRVVIQPSSEPSGSARGFGFPLYSTSVRKTSPFSRSSAGRTVSSLPVRLYRAPSPWTVTPSTFRPLKSRLKELSPCSARAVITAVPRSCPSAGS